MNWSIEDSKLVHGLNSQDMSFLDINDNGDLLIKIGNQSITMREIIQRLKSKLKDERIVIGSFTLRVPQLVDEQINKIISAADAAMREFNYPGKFQPLYPIKVNQRKLMVRAVLSANKTYGLEAGTKSELILILKALREEKHRKIMCNGVKDHDYVNIVNQAIVDGYNIIFSIETVNELLNVMDVIPLDKIKLVLRIKPYVKIEGYWGSSSGRNSKFGVGVAEIFDIISIMREKGMQSILKGIHAHPGSQVTNLDNLVEYNRFLANVYVQLSKMGFDSLRLINLGGGLPVDYESDLTPMTMTNYFKQAIRTISEVLSTNSISSFPDIMIEAGRAITAQSSLVVIKPIVMNYIFPAQSLSIWKEAEDMIANIKDIKDETDVLKFMQEWEELCKTPDDYDLGVIYKNEYYTGLMFDSIRAHLMKNSIKVDPRDHRRIYKSKYYLLGNFSIFNSAADHVLVDQYFPVMTIDNLNTRPQTICRFVDLTCDSDGEISSYVIKKHSNVLYTKDGYPLTGEKNIKLKGFPVSTLDLLDTYVVIPLVGGYQDVIEFDHNLIGDLPDVKLTWENNEFKITFLEQVQNISDLVREVGYTIETDRNPYFDY